MGRSRRQVALLLAALALGGCAHTPPDDPSDPLETVNRGIYKFNEKADQYVLRPVAKGYDKVMPGFARTGVRNFFSNLFYPTVMVNDLLQLKFLQFAADTGRLVANTLVGWGGLFDVATPAGLVEHSEDFGQTLGYWGVGPGWYLVLPFIGPSNNRDFIGTVADGFTSPLFYADDDKVVWGLTALQVVDGRAGLLGADKMIEDQLDPYVFVRSIYLQSREGKVYDGNPPKEDFGFEDEEEAAPEEEPKPETPTP